MVSLGSVSFPLGVLHPSFSYVSLDDVELGSLPPCSSSPLCHVLCLFASPWDARGQGCRRTPQGAGDPWAWLTGVCSWSTGLCWRKSLMERLCQSWSASLSPCLEFLNRTRNLGFMKCIVPCRREPQNFQNCFAFKKKPQNMLLLLPPVLQAPAVDGSWRGPSTTPQCCLRPRGPTGERPRASEQLQGPWLQGSFGWGSTFS